MSLLDIRQVKKIMESCSRCTHFLARHEDDFLFKEFFLPKSIETPCKTVSVMGVALLIVVL